MATITLSNPSFYKDGQTDANSYVGYSSVSYFIGRYELTAPSEGARHIQFELTKAAYVSGASAEKHSLCFYIGTSESSHIQADSNSPYTGQLNMSRASDGSYIFTGEADILLFANAKYYVWVFSINVPLTNRYAIFSLSTAAATITTTGGAGLVRIDNGNSFDMYQAYIDNGASWDLYMPYRDNGSNFDLCS